MNTQQKKDILKNLETEKDLCHLIFVPFTGLGRPRYRGDEWFAKRVEIFKENTLKSIVAQTNPFFTLWLCFREEEASNPITTRLWEHIRTLGIPVIFTFGGIPMWDDKYPDDNLLERFKLTLPELRSVVGNSKYVYETILASDDMYHKDVVQTIHQQPFKNERALVHWTGYIRNLATGQIGEWKPMTQHLPPFYTIMYDADTFLNPEKHFEYLKEYKSHEDVEKMFDCVNLPDYHYMVNVHGNNISTSWIWHRDETHTQKHPFIGDEITDETEKQKILCNFGAM